jgi:hypothetical protein
MSTSTARVAATRRSSTTNTSITTTTPTADALHADAYDEHESVAEHGVEQHTHDEGCGHETSEHGDHVDYLHDAHKHAMHAEDLDDRDPRQHLGACRSALGPVTTPSKMHPRLVPVKGREASGNNR